MEDNSDIPILDLNAPRRERRPAFSFTAPAHSTMDLTEFRALSARQSAQEEAIIDDDDEDLRVAFKAQVVPKHDSGMLHCDSLSQMRT